MRGVAPALILYLWGLHELGNVGWIAAMVFAICAVLYVNRLVTLDRVDCIIDGLRVKRVGEKNFEIVRQYVDEIVALVKARW